jgi:DNA-binding CsgD family transcriptional regulator/tetratricopeptide (TPR) repeat protein
MIRPMSGTPKPDAQSETPAHASGVVGREAELAALAAAIGPAAAGRGLVLVGAPGMGKTTLWTAAVSEMRGQEILVLVARPAAPEAGLSFAGLADLFDAVGPAALAGLPMAIRRALEVALLRVEPSGPAPGERQISVGTLELLRALAGASHVLVAVDDVNWLDGPSTQALAFAARRLADQRIRFLLARRPGRPSVLERAFAHGELVNLEVLPLSFGAIRTVLSRRLPVALPRRIVQQIHESSGGNPLYALEIGRLVADRGPADGAGELPVPDEVDDLVGERVARLAPGVRRLLAAVSLGADLRPHELAVIGDPELVAAAIAEEVLIEDDERLRPAHPLLAAAARARLMTSERRDLHRELATLAGAEEVRARHLALGTGGHDGKLAARLAAASARAASRGAAVDAVDLAEHALRLTPPRTLAWSEQLLTLGERLVAAGEHRRASQLLGDAFDWLPEGRARARAHLLLNESAFHGDQVELALRHLDLALEESAREPDLHARVVARRSRYLSAALVASIAEAERLALTELPSASAAGPAIEREILYSLAFARKIRGRPIDDLLERFRIVSADAFMVFRGVERIAADRLASRGFVGEARQVLRRLLAEAEDRGESWSSIWLLHQLAEVEVRAGDWKMAAQLLDECDASPDRGLLDPQGYARCRALVAAGIGRIDAAAELANQVIVACQAEGLRWNQLEALRARGQAALLAHSPADAVRSLAEVWEHTEREGVEEPGEFPAAPDLIEALVELRQLVDAAAVAARLRTLAKAQDHPWALATAIRGEALTALAAGGDVDAALRRTREAAERYALLGLTFDRARTLRAAGREARRIRKWGAARDLLGQAREAFAAIGSDGWAADVLRDLGRLGGRSPGPAGGLTAAEREVASLAAEGRSNKEIAAALVIGVSTVETHLRHAFEKLHVGSRAQLARRLDRG